MFAVNLKKINTHMFERWPLHDIERMKMSPNLPYATYVENKNSPDMLVYFGNYNGYARGLTTIRSLNCNALVMRSDEASWYLQPFPHGSCPENVAKNLDKFINSKPHIKNVVYAGFSMGAYGALLYPTWAKRVDKIVASSPQTVFPDYIVANKYPQIQDKFFEQYRSIRELWEKHGSPDAEIILQACGERLETEGFRDYADCMELAHFPRVTIHKFDCVGHTAISSHLLNDVDAYNNLFLYRDSNR
jgi:pimeloyl-ACP methyl ester carboxylesterase